MCDFKRSRRLLTKRDYDNVFKQSQKKVTPKFIFFYVNNNCGHARLGLAISKKMVAKACDRNYIKRLLRESFRNSKLPSIDVIVIVRDKSVIKHKSNLFITLSNIWESLVM